uniref:Mitochondrial calcium uniporter regulator 1 n=1 Tax=Erpetoichthys calabaricus TaxID=27687 RepID=A0A8C4XCJ6_ERPCA
MMKKLTSLLLPVRRLSAATLTYCKQQTVRSCWRASGTQQLDFMETRYEAVSSLLKSHGFGSACRHRCFTKTAHREDVITPLSLYSPIAREFSSSAALLQYGLRKVDIPPPESSKFYFDTHAVVRLLEDQGLSTSQAEVIVASLIQILKSFVEVVHKDMVTKVQQEIMLQQVMSHIASAKKDMVILEKSEFTALRAENEKVKIELQQLKTQLADEMNKVRSDAIMDMNLEKSRVKEMYAEHEKNLLERRSEIVELHAEQDKAVTQTIRKIDTEVAGLKTMLESHKLDTIKYLAGSVFTCLTVALGFYRLWI